MQLIQNARSELAQGNTMEFTVEKGGNLVEVILGISHRRLEEDVFNKPRIHNDQAQDMIAVHRHQVDMAKTGLLRPGGKD